MSPWCRVWCRWGVNTAVVQSTVIVVMPLGAGEPRYDEPDGPWPARPRRPSRVCASGRHLSIPAGLTPYPLGWEHAFVPPPGRPKEEIEQLRRSIAMLQPGALAMKREDAMRLLSELGEVRGRLDGLCDGMRALLNEEDRHDRGLRR